jgi:hypothetical protein
MKNLFLQVDGKDLYDGSSGWFYVYNIFLWIYSLGTLCATSLQLTAQVTNTYTRGRVYGVLYSLRYTQAWWFVLSFMGLRWVTFMAVCLLILYRRTVSKKNGVPVRSIVCGFVIFVTYFLELWGIVVMGYYWWNANGLLQADNPANNPRWCCDPLVNRNELNGCNMYDTYCQDGGLNDASKMSRYIVFEVIFGTSIGFWVIHNFFAWVPFLWAFTNGFQTYRESSEMLSLLFKQRQREMDVEDLRKNQ